jgi:hypothetical protein
VIAHTMTVSMSGPSIATSPSRTGSSVFAAACAMAAIPTPASFENAARCTPTSSVPSAPPRAASGANAERTMSASADGTADAFATSTSAQAAT